METASEVPVAAAVTVVPKMDVAAVEDPLSKHSTAPSEHPTPHLLMGAAGTAPERPTPQLLMGAGPGRSTPYHTGAGGVQPAMGKVQPGMQRVPIYPEPNAVEHLVCCCCLGM